ncbi:sulfite exporter TauE/SafE family protein [Terriglobus tenax]|uniref:sulfite exporter TauE/SafE family protein n=1 Tax=Terriglobus tenax TaxID=1111115 RepID=UPI0021E0DD38|nr:sulfite exporter TauE/SafE family protein [Terriglobus tenax]
MPSYLTTHGHYLWLVAASFIAGVMNALAGGGSFVSFPAMLAVGVPPIQANATNTVAIWPGQLTSLAALKNDLRRDVAWVVVLASIIGGIGGALILLRTREATFLRVLPWMLLAASLIFGVSGRISRWLRGRTEHPHLERKPSVLYVLLALLPVTFYIGYFGAGAGFLIMTVMALFGVEEMHQLNSLKVLGACVSNLAAVFTFIVRGAVVWHYCLVAMVFAGLGGWLGARYARRMNGDVLRVVVVVTGCAVAGWFFYLNSR